MTRARVRFRGGIRLALRTRGSGGDKTNAPWPGGRGCNCGGDQGAKAARLQAQTPPTHPTCVTIVPEGQLRHGISSLFPCLPGQHTLLALRHSSCAIPAELLALPPHLSRAPAPPHEGTNHASTPHTREPTACKASRKLDPTGHCTGGGSKGAKHGVKRLRWSAAKAASRRGRGVPRRGGIIDPIRTGRARVSLFP